MYILDYLYIPDYHYSHSKVIEKCMSHENPQHDVENELPSDFSELIPQNDDEERQVDGYIEDQAFNG